jgi:hypothetical protein
MSISILLINCTSRIGSADGGYECSLFDASYLPKYATECFCVKYNFDILSRYAILGGSVIFFIRDMPIWIRRVPCPQGALYVYPIVIPELAQPLPCLLPIVKKCFVQNQTTVIWRRKTPGRKCEILLLMVSRFCRQIRSLYHRITTQTTCKFKFQQ